MSAISPNTEVKSDLGQKPVADKRADDTDQQIANQAEACAAHHLTGKPAGNDPDDKNDEKALVRKDHCDFLRNGFVLSQLRSN